MQPVNLFSTSINISCGQETFCLLPSIFHWAGRLSVKFCQLSLPPGQLHQHPLNFCAARRPSFNLHQLLMRSAYLPSISVNIPCSCEMCQIPTTFCVTVTPSVNFCQLAVWPGDLPLTFCSSVEPSVHFCQLSVQS